MNEETKEKCAECKKAPEDNRYMYKFVRDGDFGPLKEVITYCRDCYKKKFLDQKERR